ncbi:unnamed protein product [Durusdinium trenchii]|uniref:J domain-containing protein n=2 Tax=Durusdinium trenchii TaxID=1381693 RepID=A0ABP0N0H2_9DINO
MSGGFDFDELEDLEQDRPLRAAPRSDEEAEAEDEAEADDLFDYDPRCTVATGLATDVALPAVAVAVETLDARPRGPAEAAESPNELREVGNTCFRSGDFEGAERFYSTALAAQQGQQSPRLFSNRAATRLKLAKWDQALQDIMEATKRDPANPKVCERFARCLLLNNRLPEGVHICRQRLKNLTDAQKADAWKPFIEISSRLSHHAGVLHEMEGILNSVHSSTAQRIESSPVADARAIVHGCDSMLKLLSDLETTSPFGVRLRFGKLRAYLYPIPGSTTSDLAAEERLDWAKKALQLTEELLQEDPRWPDSHHWRARALVRLQRRSEAREALRRAQLCAEEKGGQHNLTEELLDGMRHVDQQKERGNEAYRTQEWSLAKECYDLAIAADALRMDVELSAQLHCNRASVWHRLEQTSCAMEDLHLALRLVPSYGKARVRRGMLYMELERYGEAVHDFEIAFKETPRFEGLSAWRAVALRWAARPPRRNFYALLGLGVLATPQEIKKAYRKMALRWHPDKNVDRAEEAAQRFKEVQEAFEVLSDPARRSEWDPFEATGNSFGYPGRPAWP